MHMDNLEKKYALNILAWPSVGYEAQNVNCTDINRFAISNTLRLYMFISGYNTPCII